MSDNLASQLFQSPTGVSDAERGLGSQPLVLTQAQPRPGEQSHPLRTMSSAEIDQMSLQEVRAFYQEQLGPYAQFVFQSALTNHIPPQLLAAVILTELSDISKADVLQDLLEDDSGSLGIAQIQVSTARQYGLTEQPGEREALQSQLRQMPSAYHAASLTKEISPEKRLLQPKFAIEAAARYIRILLEKMTQNLDKPWQKNLGFRLTDIKLLKRPEDLYNFIVGGNILEREGRAALIVAAAYNSPDIIIAKSESSFDEDSAHFIYIGAVPHGQNAMRTAERLAQPPSLFHLRF